MSSKIGSRTIGVRFTDTFLKVARIHFSEEDLKELSNYLATFPDAGCKSKESDSVCWLNWHSTQKSPELGDFTVWYLVNKDVPEIDVLALILPGERTENASSGEVVEALAKVALIGRLLHRVYRVYERAKDFLDQFPDLGG